MASGRGAKPPVAALALGASSAPVAGAVRKRPRNRKAQILTTAAHAFSARGYYSVGVNEIAAELGISGPALYRHFPNKYALFVAVAEASAHALLDAASTATESGLVSAPRDDLESVLRAVIGVTIDNRAGGGIYRWEGRYLEQADRKRIRGIFDDLNACVATPLRAVRPDLPQRDVAMLAAAALSVIASITAHHTPMPKHALTTLLLHMSTDITNADLHTPDPVCDFRRYSEGSPAWAGERADAKSELLIDEAVRMFSSRGYHETSMEDIATAAGMTASGLYRHFDSKADLLAAALDRTSQRLSAATSEVVAEWTGPKQALCKLAEAYVTLSFANPDLLSVYFAEFGNLPDGERARLRNVQRRHVREWAQLVAAVNPDASDGECHFRVHAALGLVLDIGRLTRFDNQPETLARIHMLMTTVLLS